MGVCEPPLTDFGATHAKFRCHAVCTTFLTGTSNACSSPERDVVLGLEWNASSLAKHVRMAFLLGFTTDAWSWRRTCERFFQNRCSSTLSAESVSWPPRMRWRSTLRSFVYRAAPKMNSPTRIALSSCIHESKGFLVQAASGS